MTNDERKTKICFTAYNRDTWCGCHNADDDWSITVYGDSYDEALKNAAKACKESSIILDYVEASEVKTIEYDGKTFVVDTTNEEVVCDRQAKKDLINAIKEMET